MDTVEQKYWDKSYNNFNYFISKPDSITDILDKFIPNCKNKTVFEIGCFPLRYLSYLGKKGAIISGCDLSPEIKSKDLLKWLEDEDIKTENLYHTDYKKLLDENKQYDVVMSMGFVEHFFDYQNVIKEHLQFVKKGGILIITAPNFAGFFQKRLHKLLDNENLKRHHLPSMEINKWREVLAKDSEILYSGYFGKIDFWVDSQKRGFFLKIINSVVKIIFSLLKKIKFLIPNNKAYSPYLGIVAIKK